MVQCSGQRKCREARSNLGSNTRYEMDIPSTGIIHLVTDITLKIKEYGIIHIPLFFILFLFVQRFYVPLELLLHLENISQSDFLL